MSHGDIEIIFKPIETRAVSTSNKVLLDIARECGIPIRADCGGIGICGKCRVRFEFVDGELSKPTQSELNILGEKSIAEGYRLACQVKLISGRFIIYIPSESIIQKYRSADIGLEKPLVLKPAIN
ncbi:MAG: 2Fe-2S iron-sulfur cluster-binding protein, partial [Ignisphaera sp.]